MAASQAYPLARGLPAAVPFFSSEDRTLPDDGPRRYAAADPKGAKRLRSPPQGGGSRSSGESQYRRKRVARRPAAPPAVPPPRLPAEAAAELHQGPHAAAPGASPAHWCPMPTPEPVSGSELDTPAVRRRLSWGTCDGPSPQDRPGGSKARSKPPPVVPRGGSGGGAPAAARQRALPPRAGGSGRHSLPQQGEKQQQGSSRTLSPPGRLGRSGRPAVRVQGGSRLRSASEGGPTRGPPAKSRTAVHPPPAAAPAAGRKQGAAVRRSTSVPVPQRASSGSNPRPAPDGAAAASQPRPAPAPVLPPPALPRVAMLPARGSGAAAKESSRPSGRRSVTQPHPPPAPPAGADGDTEMQPADAESAAGAEQKGHPLRGRPPRRAVSNSAAMPPRRSASSADHGAPGPRGAPARRASSCDRPAEKPQAAPPRQALGSLPIPNAVAAQGDACSPVRKADTLAATINNEFREQQEHKQQRKAALVEARKRAMRESRQRAAAYRGTAQRPAQTEAVCPVDESKPRWVR